MIKQVIGYYQSICGPWMTVWLCAEANENDEIVFFYIDEAHPGTRFVRAPFISVHQS